MPTGLREHPHAAARGGVVEWRPQEILMRLRGRPFLLAAFAATSFVATAFPAGDPEARPLDTPPRRGEAGPVRGVPGGGAPLGRGARGTPADAVLVTVN